MRGKHWFRRLLTVGLVIAVALPLVGFGLSNLYLSSPNGRIFVASKIREHTGLEASVMGSSWSPWNGIHVYGIRIEQPGSLKTAVLAPLLRIESLQLDPAWRPLVTHRTLLLKGIALRRPKLVLPLELLSQIPREAPVVTAPPVVAQVNPAVQGEPIPIPPVPISPAVSATKPLPSIPEEKPVADIESEEETTAPTVWIKFFGAGLKIVSTKSKEPLYEISDMGGAAPLGGKRATSEVVLNKIVCLGKPLVETMTVPLKWRSPMLDVGPINGELFGMECEAAASISLSGSIPFRINAILPEQKNKEIVVGEKMKAKFGSVAGGGVFQGQLVFPVTWQGQWIAQAVSIDTSFAEKTATFDQGQSLVVFRNGALNCIDARLVGDALTLIGNAALLSDGRAAANVRIIAAPETLVAISKYTEPDSSAPSLTPLSTPQRAALDLQLFGRFGEFYLKPNPRALPIPLN